MKTQITLVLLFASFFSTIAFGQKTLLDLRFKQKEAKRKAAVRAPIVSTRHFYDHRSPIRRNSIRIQPAQLYNSIRVSYERVVLSRVAVGTSANYHIMGDNKGTAKAEIYGKYFLVYRAPMGLYLYNSHGIANIANQTMNYRLSEVGAEPRFNYSRPYLLSQQASYSTYIGTVGVGFQNVIGKRKNVIIDFGLAYQYYILPDRFKTSYSQFNAVYGNFGASNHILGPTSPVAFRFAVGYAF